MIGGFLRLRFVATWYANEPTYSAFGILTRSLVRALDQFFAQMPIAWEASTLPLSYTRVLKYRQQPMVCCRRKVLSLTQVFARSVLIWSAQIYFTTVGCEHPARLITQAKTAPFVVVIWIYWSFRCQPWPRHLSAAPLMCLVPES